MRKALSLKSNNVIPNGNVTHKSIKEIAPTDKEDEVADKREEELFKPNKENFEVFEDPGPSEPPESTQDVKLKLEQTLEEAYNENNMIHELERKLEEKIREGTTDKSDKVIKPWQPLFLKLTHLQKEKKDCKVEKDALMVASEDYFSDMFKYMKSRQMKHRPPHDYISKKENTSLNEGMRTILVDWLHDVVREYRLQTETLHLAVSIADRITASEPIEKETLQLVGTTALLIATKYEEIYVPEIEEFAIITNYTYRIDQILEMEQQILRNLNFEVSPPTAAWFGNCFANRMGFTRKMKKALQYLLNLSLVEIDFLRFKPSSIAAASICFTNLLSEKEAWPDNIQEDTGIQKEEFVECLKELYRLFVTASEAVSHSMYKKFSGKEQEEISLMPAPTEKLRELFPSMGI